jgi:predicted membrane protein DUF2232
VAGIAVSRDGAAGTAALFGDIATLPSLAAPSGSLGAMMLIYLTQQPLFAAGLWLGVEASVIAGVVGLGILVADSNLPTAAVFAGLNAFPFVRLVRGTLTARSDAGGGVDWYPPGLLTGLGLAVIAAVVLVLGGLDGIRASSREAPAFDSSFGGNTTGLAELLDSVAFVLPGLIAGSWMAMTSTNGILGQGLAAHFGANWRPSPDMAALSPPIWILVLLAFATAATLLGGTAHFIAINVMIVLAVSFCLTGLAVLHVRARKLARPLIPLVTFCVLAGLFGWRLLLVALLGVLDSSLGVRPRFTQS